MTRGSYANEDQADADAAPAKRRSGLVVLAVVGILSLILWFVTRDQGHEALQNFQIHEQPAAVRDIGFLDAAAQRLRLSSFAGKFVLLNLWATWCTPCRREMPTLDRLQAVLGGPGFEVVALSIDRQGLDAVAPFYAALDLNNLAMYADPSAASQRALHVFGIPTTLLIDRQGREIARLVGPATWDSPAIIQFISDRMAGKPIAASGNRGTGGITGGASPATVGLD